MKHSLSSQIQAIQVARKLLTDIANTVKLENKDLDERLNDAGSTIAAMNLTKTSPAMVALKAAYVAFEMIRIQGYDVKLTPQAISALNEAMPLVSKVLYPNATIETKP